jgi:hypothetical protein
MSLRMQNPRSQASHLADSPVRNENTGAAAITKMVTINLRFTVCRLR